MNTAATLATLDITLAALVVPLGEAAANSVVRALLFLSPHEPRQIYLWADPGSPPITAFVYGVPIAALLAAGAWCSLRPTHALRAQILPAAVFTLYVLVLSFLFLAPESALDRLAA
ncbi:MAG: hypothetical protein KC492_19155 [Myxococcales bacterium]|nr:hypothetical protein [Myxococcales bacterium]